jgi:hypothetical protein
MKSRNVFIYIDRRSDEMRREKKERINEIRF